MCKRYSIGDLQTYEFQGLLKRAFGKRASSNAPVSVIIPVRANEHPAIVISSLEGVRDRNLIREIFVVGGRSPSEQRNYAASLATAPYLYFLDNDSAVDDSALSVGVRCLADPSIAAVGGPALAFRDSSPFQQACDAVLGSYFGTFLTRARHVRIGKPRTCVNEELILCNLMIRRDVFLNQGGFRKDLYPNEENELLKRISRHNFQFYYHPELSVSRPRRATLRAFLEQSISYGFGRARHIRHGFRILDIAFLAPSAFASCLVVFCFSRSLTTTLPLVLYFGVVLGESFRHALQQRSLRFGLRVACLFPLLHISYGIGFARGLLSGFGTSRTTVSFDILNSDAPQSVTPISQL